MLTTNSVEIGSKLVEWDLPAKYYRVGSLTTNSIRGYNFGF